MYTRTARLETLEIYGIHKDCCNALTVGSHGVFGGVSSRMIDDSITPLERHYAILPCYHPVHLGDFFKDGRYKILHKLGFGSFSTVWLARDIQYVQFLRLLFLATFCNSQQSALQHIPQSCCGKIRVT